MRDDVPENLREAVAQIQAAGLTIEAGQVFVSGVQEWLQNIAGRLMASGASMAVVDDLLRVEKISMDLHTEMTHVRQHFDDLRDALKGLE